MSVFILLITVLSQRMIQGDTLRWYDPESAGYTSIGVAPGSMYWGVRFPVDSGIAGRTVFSARIHLSEMMDSAGTAFLCKGGASPDTVLDMKKFLSVGYGFYEVRFSPLDQQFNLGDTIWLWCSQPLQSGQYPVTVDSGPAVRGLGDMISTHGITWEELIDYGFDYNWVMELILEPEEVSEDTHEAGSELALLPAPGGFYITGYKGPAQIYDPAGRLILTKEIKGKTRIEPLRPGVYMVVAGRQKGKVVIR